MRLAPSLLLALACRQVDVLPTLPEAARTDGYVADFLACPSHSDFAETSSSACQNEQLKTPIKWITRPLTAESYYLGIFKCPDEGIQCPPLGQWSLQPNDSEWANICEQSKEIFRRTGAPQSCPECTQITPNRISCVPCEITSSKLDRQDPWATRPLANPQPCDSPQEFEQVLGGNLKPVQLCANETYRLPAGTELSGLTIQGCENCRLHVEEDIRVTGPTTLSDLEIITSSTTPNQNVTWSGNSVLTLENVKLTGNKFSFAVSLRSVEVANRKGVRGDICVLELLGSASNTQHEIGRLALGGESCRRTANAPPRCEGGVQLNIRHPTTIQKGYIEAENLRPQEPLVKSRDAQVTIETLRVVACTEQPADLLFLHQGSGGLTIGSLHQQTLLKGFTLAPGHEGPTRYFSSETTPITVGQLFFSESASAIGPNDQGKELILPTERLGEVIFKTPPTSCNIDGCQNESMTLGKVSECTYPAFTGSQ